MKYAIKPLTLDGSVYYVIFDNVHDTSSHLFKTKEEAKKALEAGRGKPASHL